MINFNLKHPEQIQPAGNPGSLNLCWFYLTDGDLWLELGNETIYEYATEALAHFGNKPTPYNDYYISRFVEDFSEIFTCIAETIPEDFYELTANCSQFKMDTQKWLNRNETDGDEQSDFYLAEYDGLTSWIHRRTFDSGHLVGGPKLSFFRYNDIIRIDWQTKYKLDNGIKLWKAKDGNVEMNYNDFVKEVKLFGEQFFSAMSKQVATAIARDWGNIQIDKQQLLEEHEERKQDFYNKLSHLTQSQPATTNWAETRQLYYKMVSEII